MVLEPLSRGDDFDVRRLDNTGFADARIHTMILLRLLLADTFFRQQPHAKDSVNQD